VKFVQDVSRVGLEAGGSGQIAGVTTMTHDKTAFINKSTITLPKAASYVEEEYELGAYAQNQFSSQLKEAAIHEIGDALGLGHANFEGDITNESVNYDGAISISNCDIKAVPDANHWKLLHNTTTSFNPTTTSVSCSCRFFCSLFLFIHNLFLFVIAPISPADRSCVITTKI
jgi:hypothetical protein